MLEDFWTTLDFLRYLLSSVDINFNILQKFAKLSNPSVDSSNDLYCD